MVTKAKTSAVNAVTITFFVAGVIVGLILAHIV
jgi:hypothetical protein